MTRALTGASTADIGWYVVEFPSAGADTNVIAINEGTLQSNLVFSDGTVARSEGAMSADIWQHIVVTYDGVTRRHYVNGTEAGSWTENADLAMNASALYIGGTSISKYWNGTIDNVRVYNRSLSSQQVLKLYQNKTDELSKREIVVGDVWQACVTPNDGKEDGQENCSNTLSVKSLSVVDVVLNSSYNTNYSNENLTVYLELDSQTTEGIKTVTNWYLNSTSVAVLNMPFEAVSSGNESSWTKDYTNFSNNGNVTGATWSGTSGYDGFGAYAFDGTNDYIDVGNDSSLRSVREAVAITAWVKSSDEGYVIAVDPPAGTVYNFTTCSQTGRNGPSQGNCDSNYSGTTLDGDVTVGGGIQNWTVPQTGTYTIEARGASGGGPPTSYTSNYPGKGAIMRGEFDLIAGQEIQILVGQRGTWLTHDGGGGGGTFVVNATNSTIIIAGGGGGPSYSGSYYWGTNASTGSSGTTGTYGDGAGGTNGGGGTTAAGGYAGPGGGLIGNGGTAPSSGLAGGLSFINGGTGGDTGSNCYGGFGGGGGSHGGGWGGGGGGGYSGGGGSSSSQYGGGGGGSNNTGDNQVNSEGTTLGEGWVTITYEGVDKAVPFALSTVSGGQFLIQNATDTYSVTTDGDINDDEWHHIAATYDGTIMRLYIDGQLNASNTTYTGSLPDNNDSIWIGRHYDPDDTTAYFDGIIDEVVIWNRSLTPTQIEVLYRNRTDRMMFTETASDDVWEACMTPNDGGRDISENCSDTVTVIGSSPYVNMIELNSTSGGNFSSDNLTVYYTSVTDAGLTNKNITDWKMNGSSIAVLNMPFEYNGENESVWTKDYSNNSDHGTVSGATWLGSGGYDGFGAYAFDGNDDYITTNATHPAEDVSFEAWFKTKDLTSLQVILDKSIELGPWRGFRQSGLGLTDEGKPYVRVAAAGGYCCGFVQLDSPDAVTANEWHHVVGTYSIENGNISIYVDGVQKNSNSGFGEIVVWTYPFRIGTRINESGPKEAFNGTIDEVRIYNKTLSAEQVALLYDNQTDIIHSNELGGDETWYACITPNDGVTEGAINCSNTLFVPRCYDDDADGAYNLNTSINPGCLGYRDCDDGNASLVPPRDGLNVTGDMMFCNGTFFVNDSAGFGLGRVMFIILFLIGVVLILIRVILM
jgi:hypothetical protein